MVQIETTGLEGIVKITPPTNFEDFRGSYDELYYERLHQDVGIGQKIIQDDISTSNRDSG